MRLSTILLGIEGLIEQWYCNVYFSSILFGLVGLIEQRRYMFVQKGVMPEVVDCGIAEGEQDGVEGETLEGILLTRQQRVQAYAANKQMTT